MLWAIFSTFLDAVASITRKKSLELNSVLSAYGFKILWLFGPFVLLPYFILTGSYSYEFVDVYKIFAIVGIVGIRIISTNIWQSLYKYEKVSVLMPYENLNKVFTIIASFYLLHDGNFKTVIVSFCVIFLLGINSIDFKNFRLPKIFWLVLLHQVLTSLRAIGTAYIIKILGNYVDYFIIESVLLLAFNFFWMMYYQDIQKLSWLSTSFYKFRLLAGIIGTLAYVIGLYLISSLWMITTIILSFVWIAVKLLLWYVLLHDTASWKNIVTALMVTLLVGLWFIFK